MTENPTDEIVEGLDPRIDKENAFLVFAIFCGDAIRTAHALDVTPEIVETLAREKGWYAKIKPIIDLKQSTRAGDVERAVNRALNFTQSYRFRLFLERVLRKMTSMSPHDLDAFLFPQAVKGSKEALIRTQIFTTRALADLAAALEKCHSMTYLALNDTATERKERKETGDDDATAAEMHLRLAQAMTLSGGGSKSVAGLVAEGQLQIAQEFARVDLQAPASDILPASE